MGIDRAQGGPVPTERITMEATPRLVPAPRSKLKTTLKTDETTDEAVRSLTRVSAAELDRAVIHNEVISAAIKVAEMHMPLFTQYLRGDQ